eukprot:CAMPEP_0194028108 /NCGR_PEP_ID=MMETSP0009_2-20130614/2132_1 /TAXON_ID=210454 /ORGANISM="Grammatophora oceanica, Strain CCMP 410" /LENGTH=440 /DNA_ID=CAMNT_0038667377 /DNA_START=242 /DNA_END=1564 /DNA_ORIENTATION=-
MQTSLIMAKEKFDGMWESIRSLSQEQQREATFTGRLRKAIEMPSAESMEAMVKTIFGSCTAAGEESESVAQQEQYIEQPLRRSPSQKSTVSSSPSAVLERSPSRQKEEYFYSQFLTKDRRRAAKAVSSVREKQVPSPLNQKPLLGVRQVSTGHSEASKSQKQQLSKPFPMSSPMRTKERGVELAVPSSAQNLTQDRNYLPNGLAAQSELPAPAGFANDFDDGISAISAYTLEEMAKEVHRKRHQQLGTVKSDLTTEGLNESGESSTLFPNSSPEHGKSPYPIRAKQRGGPSFGSKGTYGTKQTFQTKSTRSTTTADFENAWRRDEQKYWQDVVEEDAHHGGPPSRRRVHTSQKPLKNNRSRSYESSKVKTDRTITTMGSSTYHSDRTPLSRSHPHDTLFLEASDCVPRKVVQHAGSSKFDPDRLQAILVLEHEATEIGEI